MAIFRQSQQKPGDWELKLSFGWTRIFQYTLRCSWFRTKKLPAIAQKNRNYKPMKFCGIGRGHSRVLATPDIAFSALEKVLPDLGLSIAEIGHLGPVRQHTDCSKYRSQLEPISRILALPTQTFPRGLFRTFSSNSSQSQDS
jgi:hypothetical protein